MPFLKISRLENHMRVDEKFELITNGNGEISEIITKSELQSCLENKYHSSMWGISVKNILHFGFDPLIVKQWDLIKSNFEHTVLIADVHTTLNNPNVENFDAKTNYTYSYFKDLCNLQEADFVKGSSFQYSEEYGKRLTRLASLTGINSVRKISAVNERATLGDYMYPAMQALDAAHLNVNLVYGGNNQRGTYLFAREFLPKIGLKKPIVLLSKMSLDIMGHRLEDSTTATRITIHDSEEILKHKINRILTPASIEDNPLLSYIKFSVIPWFKRVDFDTTDGPLTIQSYKEFETLYLQNKISPAKAKETLYIYLSQRIEKIRRYFERKPYYTDWINFDRLNQKSAMQKVK